MSGMSRGQQAVAAAGMDSRVKQHWHCCRRASQAPPAHSRQQAAGGRPSACQASTRAPQMLVSAVRQQEHTCTSTCAVVAHGAAACHSVHPRGQPSIPRPRGTSDANAHQPVGLLLPNLQLRTRQVKASQRRAVSTTIAAVPSRKLVPHLPHDFTNPTPYDRGSVRDLHDRTKDRTTYAKT